MKKMKKQRVGLFVGRFEPFHNGHLYAVKECAAKVDLLWIGIGSINKKNKENPLSFRERVWMIHTVLENERVMNIRVFGMKDYPNDQIWVDQIIAKTGPINVIFTGNKWTAKCFAQKGYRVELISLLARVSATKVREKLRTNGPWKQMVPVCLHSYLERYIYRSKSF